MVGEADGYLVGELVSPTTVGTEVTGIELGLDEGFEVGALEVGLAVGEDEGMVVG